jgi:alpha-tubulin suppressor-like RCC1 family protein
LLNGGSVKCWGQNSSGEVGQGATSGPVTTPTAVTLSGAASDLVSGYAHFCALIASNGGVQCWGTNLQGQLGVGNPNVSLAGPTAVVGVSGSGKTTLTGVTALASGGQNNHECAVLGDGTTACWGDDEYYQLGVLPDGTAPETCLTGQECSTKPMKQLGLARTVKGLGLGLEQTCVLYTDGTVGCCGTNPSGQIGQDISVQDADEPTLVAGISGGASIAGGASHTCVAMTDGSVSCFGDDGYGELGNIDSAWIYGFTGSPVQVNLMAEDDTTFLGGVTSLSAGLAATCAVSSGVVECWGYASSGQTGLGYVSNDVRVIPSPVQ